MAKKRTPYLMLGVGVLLAVLLAALALGGRRTSGGIVLPESSGDASGLGGGAQGAVDVVEITPETVQAAVATLSRPAAYSRTQMVETFWSGGGSQTAMLVYVSGSRTRLDIQLADGSVRHTLLAGGLAAVWYDDEDRWTELQASELSPDLAGRTPTYETVTELPPQRIAAADYRELDGVWCIYVETVPDEAGYVDRYWVGVNTGLLHAAEREQNGSVVYRFTAGTLESGAAESLFLLPDGSALERTGEHPQDTE